jgi:linoleoyl-CoA desaturase
MKCGRPTISRAASGCCPGGLNDQIEHHLFPRVCHVHYRQLSPIVESLAAKHGVSYHTCPTLWQAIRSHYRMLRGFGDSDYETHRATVARPCRLGLG